MAQDLSFSLGFIKQGYVGRQVWGWTDVWWTSELCRGTPSPGEFWKLEWKDFEEDDSGEVTTVTGDEGSDTAIASGITSLPQSVVSALSVCIKTTSSRKSCECERIMSEVSTARWLWVCMDVGVSFSKEFTVSGWLLYAQWICTWCVIKGHRSIGVWSLGRGRGGCRGFLEKWTCLVCLSHVG